MAFRYTLNLGAAAADVVKRSVSVSLDGTVTVTDILDPAQFGTFQFVAQLGQAAIVFCNDFDAAGNKSIDSPTLSFTVTDTVPPPAPPAPTITGVEEIP